MQVDGQRNEIQNRNTADWEEEMSSSLFIGTSTTGTGCEEEQRPKETELPGREMSIRIALYSMLKQATDSWELLVL